MLHSIPHKSFIAHSNCFIHLNGQMCVRACVRACVSACVRADSDGLIHVSVHIYLSTDVLFLATKFY